MRTLLLLSVLTVAVPDRQDPNKKEVQSPQEQLLGEWQFVKAVVAGQDDLLGMKDMALIFEKDVIRVRENGQMKQGEDAGYRIDASQSPIAFDLMPKKGPDMKILGILKIEADQLVICFSGGPNAVRPTEFASAQQSPTIVMYLKRAKK
jgi:uncharacterized protein (TIGR03067 family)